MNFKTWGLGLIHAVISGAANTVTAVIVAPDKFNFTHAGLIAMGQLAGAGAIIGFWLYLKQSPLPQENK